MPIKTSTISLSTHGNTDIIDVTHQVAQSVVESGLENGIVTIFTGSSTSALTTIEYESGCLHDLQRLFDEIVPPNRHYDHNAAWGDGNGHSHVRSALLGVSLTVPFTSQHLTLGTWQQIIFIDFDVRSRHRELIIQIIGE